MEVEIHGSIWKQPFTSNYLVNLFSAIKEMQVIG